MFTTLTELELLPIGIPGDIYYIVVHQSGAGRGESATIRALLVNDDQMELETIAGQLSADGDISVDIALSGEAALEKLANAKFDAVISDYMAPPAMNGIDLLRNARARGYMGLFLLFTDKCDEALALDAILNGADHFLPKCDGSRKDVALIRSLLLKRVQRSEVEGSRQDAEAYHSLLMRIPDGFAYHQIILEGAGGVPTTMITDANDAFERTFLPSEESVLGRDIRTLLRGHDMFEKRLALAIDGVITSGTEARFTERSAERDKWFSVGVYITEPGHFVTMLSDVTALKRAERDLEQYKRKMAFIGSQVRHDLLNQLTALNGFLSLSQLKVEDRSVKEFLNKAGSSGNRMRRILELSREFERLGMSPPVWIPARSAVEKGLEQVQGDRRAVRIELEGLEVLADPNVDLVFRTLVDNAFLHGKATEVHIYQAKAGEEHKIICRDNGTGVPPEKHKLLFDDRLDHSLFLTKEALAVTGMRIEETSQGGGACFEILVPKGCYRLTPKPQS